MQYAVWEISKDMNVLIDALEVQVIDEYANKEDEVINYPHNEDVAKNHIIYGLVMKNPDKNIDEVINEVYKRVDHLFGYIDYKDNKCINHDIGLIDIQLENPNENQEIPFAALIQTNYFMDGLNERFKTLFLRYEDLPIPSTILNRDWLLSVQKEVTTYSNEITFKNWKNFIEK
ncbi:hypothetical protein [Mammaliicoccus vitulinus]|uniref:hypothetical protein n=1 Tax=Mammaliicoccus vitulinus TaxID=71237 RepID=UPI00248AFC96|nr:hypothetical protein [Mammaliicoccus vitulinus]